MCTAEDITQDLFDRKMLYLCPPANKITFQNKFDVYPARFLGYEVKPKYQAKSNQTEKDVVNKMVNNF